MTRLARWLPGRTPMRAALWALALLGGSLLAGACSSQNEGALSALHYFQRGNAAYAAEDYPRAAAHYRMALQFDATSPDVHYNLGLALYRLGAWRDAAAAFQHAARLDPNFAEAHRSLALAYDKLYDAPAAHAAYNRYTALAGEPETPAGRTAGSAPPRNAPSAAVPVTAAAPTGAAATAARGTQQAPPRQETQPAAGTTVRPDTQTPRDAKDAAPTNPFEGNRKWWTQDSGSRTRSSN